MWIVNFLPDWIFHLLLIVGLLGIVASIVLDSIPFISTNAKAIQLASGIVLGIAIFFEGAISNNDTWKSRAAALEKKVAQAEVKSAEANGALVSKLAQKEKEIAAKQTELKNRIQQSSQQMDSQCTVSSDVISILNDAAKQGAKK
jgi:hypothetical protein